MVVVFFAFMYKCFIRHKKWRLYKIVDNLLICSFFQLFFKNLVNLVQKAEDLFFRLVSFKFNIEKIECVWKNLPKTFSMNFNVSFLIFSSIKFNIGLGEKGQKKVFVFLSGIAQSCSITKNQLTYRYFPKVLTTKIVFIFWNLKKTFSTEHIL